jgi:hypothetical protein
LDNINIKLSEDSQNEADIILSAILCNSSSNTELVNKFLTILERDECSGFQYIMYGLLRRLERMKISSASLHSITISQEMFKHYVLINIDNFIKDPELNLREIFAMLQETPEMDTYDGEIRTKNILYSYLMNKFDELVTLNIPLEEGLFRLNNLYQSLMKDYSIQSIKLSANCIEDSVQINKKVFSGPEGYFDLISNIKSKLERKRAVWESIDDAIDALDSIENYNRMRANDKIDMTPIGTFGLEPIDRYADACRSDIINICATEGTGKTNYCAGFACREIMNGYSVIFMCGESGATKITDMILSYYIFITTGFEISQREISGDITQLPEEWQAVIRQARHEFFNNPNYGKLLPVDRFTYNTYKDEVKRKMNKYPNLKFGHVIIDHYGSLTINNDGSGVFLKDIYSAAAYLTSQMVALKIETGVGTLFTSHTSTSAEDALKRGNDPGTRVGALSSGSSKDVDTLILMYADEYMKKSSKIKVWIKKIRSTDDSVFSPFIVKKHFVCCDFIYSPELQDTDDSQELTQEDALNLIGEID